MEKLNMLFEQYNVFIAIIGLILLIWGIYNRIKFLCLKKASEMVSKAEGHSELTGQEKLALCIVWIEEELPSIFRNTMVKSLLSKLINYVYNNSFDFMKKYIKRKTGYDIGLLIDQLKSENNIK